MKAPAKLALAGLVASLAGPLFAFDLQGHRGARGLLPENTLPGFAATLAIGVSTLEFDLALTRDGVVVVSHNPVFEPALARADGKWLEQDSAPIYSMDLKTVKTYDVGRLNPAHKYAERYPEQKPVDGTPVPTLGEVFELVEKSTNRQVLFNIETKINPGKPDLTPTPERFVAAIVETVREHGMEQRVTLQSFDWRTLSEVRRQAPEIRREHLTVNQRWLSNLQVDQPGASPWLDGIDVDDFDGSELLFLFLYDLAFNLLWTRAGPTCFD